MFTPKTKPGRTDQGKDFIFCAHDWWPADTFRIEVNVATSIRLMDEANFQHYQRGEAYQYYGGPTENRPVHLSPPRYGRWNLIIELEGRDETVLLSIVRHGTS